MRKTKPIGVRFDSELLEKLKNASIVDTPQKALNLYEKTYLTHFEDKIQENNKTENKAKNTKEQEGKKIEGEKPVWDRTKESWIDFRVRENECLENQKTQ